MSKLFKEFEKRKQEEQNKLYLFKSGIFYISLNEDAKKLSELFNFKITQLNDTVQKAGFPAQKLEYYTKLLNNCSVDFEIVDLNYGKIENQKDYLNNQNANEIIKKIKNLDMNKISFQEAFFLLKDLNEKLNKLVEEN